MINIAKRTISNIKNRLGGKSITRSLRTTGGKSLLNLPIIFGGATKSGVKITPNTSLAFSAVYASVKVITENIASLPFQVMQTQADGKSPATDHPLHRLLKKEPSDALTSFNFRRTLIANYLLCGDGYARIVRNKKSGQPIAFEIMESSQVEPIKVKDGENYKLWYADYERQQILYPTDVIHISDLSFDGRRGMSRVMIAKESIGMSIASTNFANDFYKNGIHLGGYLGTEKELTVEAAERLRSSFKETYSGPNRVGEVAVLEDGVQFHKYEHSMPLSDAQFIETKKFQIEDVARIFGVPPHKIGHLERSTNNNIESQNTEFVENTLRPIVVLIEQEFDKKIFAEVDQETYYTNIELKGLLRGDIKTRTQFYTKLFDRGIFSINDIRALEDMNKVDGGDARFIPLNMIPLSEVDNYMEYLTSKNNGQNKSRESEEEEE